MAEDFYDITLFLIDKMRCKKCCKNVMITLLVRIIFNFLIDLAEFLLLEFDSGEPIGNVLIARYIVIGFLALHIICSVILLHHLINVKNGETETKNGETETKNGETETKNGETETKNGETKIHRRARLKLFLFFKFLCFMVDGSILSYTILIFDDFEVAIPFVKKPDNSVNWRTWSLSLICFLDMLLEIVEIILIVIALCRPDSKSTVTPSNEKSKMTNNEQPKTTTGNPSTNNKQPITTTGNPFTNNEQPIKTTANPSTNNEEPIKTTANPFTKKEKGEITDPPPPYQLTED